MKAPYEYCPSCSIFHNPAKAEEECIGVKAGFQSAGICLNYKPFPVWRCEFVGVCEKAKYKDELRRCTFSKPRLQKSDPDPCDHARVNFGADRPVVDTLTGGE